MANDTKLSPQGSVIEPVAVPGGGFDLSPTAGYDGHYPVQFSDEADATFKARVAMFESAYASARQTEKGGATLEDAKAAAKARYDAEIANLEVVYKEKDLRSTVNGVPTAASKAASKANTNASREAVDETDEEVEERKQANESAGKKTVESEDGSRRTVRSSYVLKDGESEV